MKKIILGLLAALVVTGGVLYFTGFFDKGEVTAEDNAAAEEAANELKDAVDYENIEMPDMDEDSSSVEIEMEEEFDPEAML